MFLAKRIVSKVLLSIILVAFLSISGNSQRYLSDIDSIFFIKDTVRPVIKRFENLRITG